MSSMKNVKVAEALGALASRKLISVETKTPLKDVLRTLHTNRILSVPVMENDKGTPPRPLLFITYYLFIQK